MFTCALGLIVGAVYWRLGDRRLVVLTAVQVARLSYVSSSPDAVKSVGLRRRKWHWGGVSSAPLDIKDLVALHAWTRQTPSQQRMIPLPGITQTFNFCGLHGLQVSPACSWCGQLCRHIFECLLPTDVHVLERRMSTQNVENVLGAFFVATIFLGVANGSTVQPVVAIERGAFYRYNPHSHYAPHRIPDH